MREEKTKRYWRSLEQLADTPEFQKQLAREFPEGTIEMADAGPENAWSRRNFLTLMGASMALAGLASCRKPVERIIPYVDRPEGHTPGTPLSYATTMPAGNAALGMLVTSTDGRPTKIEGNPEHPSSAGAASVAMLASILDLYDPDRSTGVRRNGIDADWESFGSFWTDHVAAEHSRGEGLVVLSEAFSSPTMWRMRQAFLRKYPRATWVSYEPISDENLYLGTGIALGKRFQPVYDVSKAKVILSLDSDFLVNETDAVRQAAGFADGRRVLSKEDKMSRLYAVESTYTATGAQADHRLRMQSSQVAGFALALAGKLKALGADLRALDGLTARPGSAFDLGWITSLAEDLISNKGQCLVIAGRRQPPIVHALACALNSALESDGRTVNYVERDDSLTSSRADLSTLVGDLNSGKVKTLVILGGNPVYNAPADLEFGVAMKKAATTIHLSSHLDETSNLCTWHINRTHFLEHWADARDIDGTLSVVQPLILPLHDGHSDVEMASLLATGTAESGYDSVRSTWSRLVSGNFESGWRQALHDGLLRSSAARKSTPNIRNSALRDAVNGSSFPQPIAGGSNLELVFYSSILGDGRHANNRWLQELPDIITHLAWDNAALISYKTANELGVKNEDMVRLDIDGRQLEMPIWISPGQADNCVAVALGYGRSDAGRDGTGVGFNTFALKTTSTGEFRAGLSLTSLGKTYELANTQDHGSMEGRPIVRETTLADYQSSGGDDAFLPAQTPHPPLAPLWNERTYDEGYQWGMTIDLNACNGCNACVIACQSENNIPTVGKQEVRNGREMHWIRLDRYYVGEGGENPEEPDDAEVSLQPVTCQHCENAPCETVCPVAATVHDSEGLNVMVYNRCIGTRYCSNNCPYKVRRFNYFNFTKDLPELIRMAQNPEVTVRSRGVMEKCTFCTQRITTAKTAAKRDGRELADGEVLTACQQSCPTKAITFGNIRDENSEVAKMKKVDRNYHLLEELYTKPRNSYLGRLRNPNPEMKG